MSDCEPARHNLEFLFPGKAADEEALRDDSGCMSWQQLARRTGQWIQLFTEEWQLPPDSSIALLMENQADYVCCLLASLCAGIWVSPINGHLKPREINHILRDAGCSHLIHDHCCPLSPETAGEMVMHELHALCRVVDALPCKEITADTVPGGTMMYTSGTSGQPKGVRRTRADTVSAAFEQMRTFGRLVGVDGNGPHLVTGPLYHAAPGLFALYDLLNGAPLLIMRRWDINDFMHHIHQDQIRHTHLVPIHFERLLKLPEAVKGGFKPDTLSLVLHGAAPVSPATKKAMIAWWGPIFREYWGATETGVITLCDSQQWLDHPGTVGKPLPFYSVSARNARGETLPAGEAGLLFARHQQRQQLFSYHHEPEKTRAAHPEPHVVTLGDIGYCDAEGFVYLTDRQHRMIISGGVNIYPAEIESAFRQSTCVADVAVFGKPEQEWGEQVEVAVVLAAGFQETTAEELLRKIADEHLATYKHPRRYHFVRELPRSPSGKLIDRYLREDLQR